MDIKEILSRGEAKELKHLFSFNSDTPDEQVLFKFNLFSRYFFVQYHKSTDAPFHEEINQANLDVYRGKLDTFVNIAFRGAGKDVKTQLFITYVILNDTDCSRRYFKVLSDDGTNSVQSVTDIYNMLVSPRIKKVYEDVFERTVFKREERKDAFTTKSGVKVQAGIVGSSQRGAKQEEARPDFIWLNDFESKKTLRSATITLSIWQNMEEARTGLELGGGCVYTCNYISEQGNVHRLITEKESVRKKVFIVPIITDHFVQLVNGKNNIVSGNITWDRYTLADINEMYLTDDDFEAERLCQPSAQKDVYFDREKLDSMPIKQPVEVIAGFKIFAKYNPSHRYAGGMDIAGGVGLDSSTSVFIDFSTIPAQVVGTFASNEILPEAFGDEIYSQANRFGGCLIAPENNKFDQTILKAKQLGAKLYTGIGKIIKIYETRPTTFGWNTNSLSKSNMLLSLREAIESGLISLNDKDLIAEAKSYTRNDLIDNAPDVRLTTRHFDILTACCIAWAMKDHARTAKPIELYDPFEAEEVNPAI